MILKTPSLLFCLFTSLLMTSGCDSNPAAQPELQSDLETHFLLISEGNSGSARVRLRQYMDSHGEAAQPLFLMGLSYHKEKRYIKAVQWLEQSAQYDDVETRYPPTWHFLGWSHYYLGNATPSIEAFRHYLTMNPDEGDSLFGLGLLSMEDGDFEEASILFQQSIDVQQDRPTGQAKSIARLADIRVQEGDRLTAIQLYREALKLDPDLYEAWYHLATTQKRVGNNEESNVALGMFEETRARVRPDLETTRFPE